MLGNQEQDEQRGPYSNYHLINSHGDSNFSNATMWNELSVAVATVNNALESNSFSQAIEHGTTAIQLFRKQFIVLLEIRGIAWSKTGNIAKQLEDALTMIDVAPDCPSGYLYSGMLYSNLGYQERAIHILEKGLVKVLQHDAQYNLLQHHLEKARMQLERRINFIATCPYEILDAIVEKLSNEDLYTCTCVSRIWRQTIVRHHSRWETFEVKDYKPHSTKLLPLVAPHVQTLDASWNPQKFIGKLLEFIQKNQFPQLQSLCIGTNEDVCFNQILETNPSPIIYKGIMTILPRIGNTLTSLVFRGVSNLPPLAIILLTCRNLSVFDNDLQVDLSWFVGLTSLISYTTRLTKIVFHFDDNDPEMDMPTDEIAALIRHSPSLKYIFLNGCSCYDILPIIEKHCPKLEQLWLNNSRMADDNVRLPNEEDDKEKNKTNKNDSNRRGTSFANGNNCGGLKYLLLCGHFPSNGSIITRLLEKSCGSLRHLYICPKLSTAASTEPAPARMQESVDWEDSIVSITFIMTALTCLHIEQEAERRGPTAIKSNTVTRLIQQSPNLLTLALLKFGHNHQGGISNDMVSAMTGLKNLQQLNIEESLISIESNLSLPTNISHFYNGIYFPALSSIIIISCPGGGDTFLHNIACIQTLEDIHIESTYNEETTSFGLARFTRLLAELPRLKDLVLHEFELDDDTVQTLASSRTLDLVEFTDELVSEEAKEYLRTHGISRVY